MTPAPDDAPQPRTLVLCLDGTWSKYGMHNTNVVRFFAMLKKDNFDEQTCYYQAGIGTFYEPGVVNPLFEFTAKVVDAAIAWYLDRHVMNAYRFLMQNYRHGDKICIFGFSRGAYTARALAGMLHKIGLLPRDNQQQIPFAYSLYARTDLIGIRLAAGFKRSFCHNVRVEFVGVWDTVSSVGVVMSKTLPFTNSNRSIKTFRHVLALDERRSKFRANNYHRPNTDAPVNKGWSLWPSISISSVWSRLQNPFNWPTSDPDVSVSEDVKGWPETDVKEVWFTGCHEDVGGGSTYNFRAHSLSNISLRWMVGEIIKSDCGIIFSEGFMDDLRLDIHSDVPEPAAADTVDALQRIHDSLRLMPLWWILEFVPMTWRWQDKYGRWHKSWGPNLGRGRDVLDPAPKFHVTVKQRIDESRRYEPAARYKNGTETFVESEILKGSTVTKRSAAAVKRSEGYFS